MADISKVGDLLDRQRIPKSSIDNIDTVDNREIQNIDTIDSIDYPEGFEPQDERTSTAFEVAEALSDTAHLQAYLKYSKHYDVATMRQVLSEVQWDMSRGQKAGVPIKNPAALYVWKLKRKPARLSTTRVMKGGEWND